MAENDIMTKLPAILAIIGAIVVIVAFFVAWLSGNGLSYNGMDLMNNKDGLKDLLNGAWQLWIPLISLILAIIVVIAAIVTFFVEIPKMYLNIGYIVLGLVILVLAIVFFTTQVDIATIPELGWKKTAVFSEVAGIGIWISLVGGVIIALVGVLDIAGVFDKLTGGSSAQ